VTYTIHSFESSKRDLSLKPRANLCGSDNAELTVTDGPGSDAARKNSRKAQEKTSNDLRKGKRMKK